MNFSRVVPALSWLKTYNFKTFRADSIAGITVWIMLVPQGMAYAMLAGMPPIYGLYGGLIPLFLYGIFGTSRQLSIGPVAISSLLVLAGISQIAEPESGEYISLVILTGLLVGILQMLLGLLRLGFLVNFLSHPIIVGFTSAAAVIIAVSQLKYLLGIPIPRFQYPYETIGYAINHISEIHWLSLILCISGIILILLFKSISRAIPNALIVTLLGIAVVLLFKLDQSGVKIVGEVPAGLPSLVIPKIDFSTVRMILPTVVTVTLICIVESIAIAKVLENKNRDCKVLPNQELFALGISKFVGAFFQSLVTSGSFTRSAINDDADAKTGAASIITAILIGLTLIFLTPIFYYLPEAILAAIILVAVKGLFDIKEAIHLWQTHRQDFALMAITFISTLTLGIELGVLVGVMLSLGMIIYRTSRAHTAVLGQLPNTNNYRNVSRFKNAIQFEGVLIFRFDAQLFFCNVDYFRNTIISMVENRNTPLQLFILDASSILDIDSSGLHIIEEITDYLHDRNIRFMVSGVIGPVRDQFHKTGLIDKIGKENHYMYIRDAVHAFNNSQNGVVSSWTANAIHKPT